jgi:hypothetical protein
METLTERLVASAGPEGSKKLYVWVRQGEWPAFPVARQDDTHLNPTGATEVARLAADAIRASRLPLAEHLKKRDSTGTSASLALGRMCLSFWGICQTSANSRTIAICISEMQKKN